MHANHVSGLSTTVQKTHEWLHDIAADLGSDDLHEAYGALRAVLHSLRDRLSVEEVAQLGAELPMLIRGIYYEGWSPSGKPVKSHKDDLFEAIRRQFPRPDRLHPVVMARAVLKAIARHVSPGQVHDVIGVLPRDLRDLWPRQDAAPCH